MAGTISRFTHRVMTESVKILPRQARFLVDKFARKGKNHPTRIVDRNSLTYSPSMAPFIEVGDEGVNVKKDTYSVETVTFPKIRLKTKYTGLDLENTSFNNPAIYIDTTPQQQMAADINDQLQKFKDMIYLRIEWMIAKMLVSGGFTYNADGVKYVIDYKRNSNNTDTVTTKWDNASSEPLQDMMNFADTILDSGSDGPPSVALFGRLAYNAFVKNTEIRDILKSQNYTVGQIKPIAGEKYFGNIQGIDLYRYSQKDSDGNFLIPEKAIIFLSEAGDLFYDFGPVHEKEGLIQTDFFSKMFTQEEPPGKFILTEANPLPMMRNINSSGILTVLS